MKVLLIEDDARLIDHLNEFLSSEGLQVERVTSETELRAAITENRATDAIILDRLLGSYDTRAALPKLRHQYPAVPIIVLSAINTPNERTDLINLGADDYMGKPFSSHELVARLKSFVRRSSSNVQNFLRVGNVIVDPINRTVAVDGEVSSLPTKEFSVLKTLAQQLGRVWSKSELLDAVWEQTADVETNVVEATVANLRKKLASMNANISVRNMRNAGYWVEV